MKSSLVSSSQPRSIAIADLNNDDRLDIVVANYGTNNIGIFISQGDGNFSEQKTYFTGSNSLPYSVTIADFNNDTNLDIAVANNRLNSIGIFLGYGNGSFNYLTSISLGSSRPIFITTGDFNNDHQVDIAVVNDGTHSIGILLGYGNVSFQNYQTYSTGYDSFPSSLVVGDLNNDSHSDIAVANYGTDTIGIFFGIGNGSFQHQRTYSTLAGSNPSSIAIGDFNNDQHLDIVVSNNGTGNLGIFFGFGNGTFQQQQTYEIGSKSYPQYVNVGDLNGDHQLDIVAVDSINNQIHIIPGFGNGSFDVITTYDGISESNPFCVALGGLNKNNQTDIVVANPGINNILILIDYFVIPSARKTILFSELSSSVTLVAVSDFNNDNILDIVFNSNGLISILIGLGNETFVSNAYYSVDSSSSLQYICVGDVNDDNQTDILIADAGTNSIAIFLGYGNGSFSEVRTYSTGMYSQPYWIGLGDFDNDNTLDLVSANYGSASIGILLGYGNGSFAPVIIYNMTSGFPVHAVAVGYIDSDYYLDLAVCDLGHMITIFLGFGNGSFYIKTMIDGEGTSFLFSLALADFNNDKHLDFVIADTWGYQITIFFGYGNGMFHREANYSTGSNAQPFYVIVDDFNNDNRSDIATSNIGTSKIFIFYGYGNGSFQLGRNYSTGDGSSPYGITAGDFRNNKQLEILVALSGNGQIAILNEYYAAEFNEITTFSTGSTPQPDSVAVGTFDNDHQSLIVTANSGNDSLNILFISNNTEMTYSIGKNSQPTYVITRDINNDQQLDIISVNSKSNSISVILGVDNGTFKNQIIYSTGDGSKPYALVSHDFNNDTRLDLIIANQGTDEIGIFYGFNYTTFQPYTSYSTNESLGASGIVVSDLNNDSYLDIAVTFFNSDSIGILLGYGNGRFSDIITYSTRHGSSPNYLGVGDFNNDNKTDIAVTNFGSNSVGIFLGYGDGSFADMMIYSLGNEATPAGIVISDLNNDSRLDIVVANSGSNNIGILFGYGNGSFSNVQLYPTGDGSTPYSVVTADMNGDHQLDIIETNFRGDSIGIFFGYGNGTFHDLVKISTGTNSNPFWTNVGDFNRDNQLDIAVVLWTSKELYILFGPVNENFPNYSTYFIGSGSQPLFVCTNDFNHDTYLDIVVVNGGTNNIIIFFGLGDGTFLQGKPFSTGVNSNPFSMIIADFNNDFRLDIAAANYASDNIVVSLGDDNEPFGSIKTISTGQGSQPHSVAIGDCNNDGRMDIIVANYGTNNVGVFLGYPDRKFGTMMTYSTGIDSSPYSLALADLNNDQNLDIAVTNSQNNSIMIMFGIGNGSFAEGIIYSTGDRSRPYQIVINDMNNDYLLDLVIANSGTSNIFILVWIGKWNIWKCKFI